MATNPNMVAIQTVTVSATSAANIQFTSIPQTYTDLKIVLSGRTTNASVADSIYFTFNSSTSNFSSRILYGSGSSASSFTQARYAGSQPGSTATASTFSNIELYIPNYTGSNNKSYSVDAVTENNATEAYAYLAAGLWSDTTAISGITLTPNAGSFVQHSTATLYGVTAAGAGSKATGGIITSDANYYYHTFVNSGTFTPTQSLTADYLVVAGGGGGSSGGGGAGGLRCTVTATGGGGSLESALSLTANTSYTVTIGAGGAGGAVNSAAGTRGVDSVFSSITSNGGGNGAVVQGNATAGTYGSGGGGGQNGAGTTTGANGSANQGFAGTGNAGFTSSPFVGGSGGGAGANGVAPANSTTNAIGGAGVATSISGSSVTYAGGGGGAINSGTSVNGGAGGSGGGGAGSNGQGLTGTAGTANRGGGGGASGQDGTGGAGGSGIVIVRYAK